MFIVLSFVFSHCVYLNCCVWGFRVVATFCGIAFQISLRHCSRSNLALVEETTPACLRFATAFLSVIVLRFENSACQPVFCRRFKSSVASAFGLIRLGSV